MCAHGAFAVRVVQSMRDFRSDIFVGEKDSGRLRLLSMEPRNMSWRK